METLSDHGARAVNPPMAFPMEMDRFPGNRWAVSLKPLVVVAGLGQMGIHRNVIHPKFGKFIVLPGFLSKLLVHAMLPLPSWARISIRGKVRQGMTSDK